MSDYSKKLLTKAINNMDALLSEFSMARKAITKDDSCLFRAVSEKLFFTQHHHQAVRESCLQYLLRHQEEYQPFIAETIGSRVDNIRDGKTRAGHLEMVIMSRMYSLDFVLFHTPSLKHYPLTDRFYNQIFLCYVNDNHYDLVYAKSFLQTAAICQAIVYDVLYREVFGLSSELDEAVIFLELQKPLSRDSGCLDCAPSQVLNTVGEDKVDILKKLGGMTSPPVPYRIAKALHPALYRNVELDIVQEERREARSSSITTKKGLAPGDKCQVLLEDKGDHSAHAYNAHIQKIDDLTQTVVAFIEELGVIQSVPADCVRPLPLAISHLDESTILPVADLNLSPYSKKNRRRKGGLANNLFGRQFTPPKNFERTQKPKESPPPRVGTPTLYSALSPRHVPSSGTAPNSSHINTECNTFTQSHYPTNIGYQEIYSDASYSPSTTPINIYPGEVITDVNNNSYNYNNNNNFSNNYNGSNCSFSPVYQDKNIPYVPVAYSGLDCHSPNNLSPSAPLTPHHAPLSHAPLNHAPLGHALDPLAQPTYCVMSGQAPAYYMPMVAVPYSNTMGPVNLGWGPSQDTAGKDLPLSDANTLRFFFNLGVEYYRMSQCGPSLQPGVVYPDGQHGPVLMDTTYSGVLTSDLPRDLPHGQSMEPRAWTGGKPGPGGTTTGSSGVHVHAKPAVSSSSSASSLTIRTDGMTMTTTDSATSSSAQRLRSATLSKNDNSSNVEDHDVLGSSSSSMRSKQVADKDEDGTGDMEVGSDGDSGCPSECTDLSPLGPTDAAFLPGDADPSVGHDVTVLPEEAVKPRGKRRYYMYGNHKLVKPIKEIPLRFQMLLAETSAAKARCEGQPIYMQQMQQQPVYDMVYYQPSDGGLAYVPGQEAMSGYECYTYCPVSGFSPNPIGSNPATNALSNMSSPTSIPLHQPTPLFVPPQQSQPQQQTPQTGPGNTSPTSQMCQTYIVYSPPSCSTSQSCQPGQQGRTLNMSFPPPSNQPPPTVDLMSNKSAASLAPTVNQVMMSLAGPQAKHGDASAKSTSGKPHAALLSVPPPNHMQGPPPPHLATLPPSSLPPPHTPNMHINNTTVLTVPQAINHAHHMSAPPPHSGTHVPPPALHHASNNASLYPAQQMYDSSNNGQQYMYVYPSPPSGNQQQQVMYMVSPPYPPTYQQPAGVTLLPPTCPVPVQ